MLETDYLHLYGFYGPKAIAEFILWIFCQRKQVTAVLLTRLCCLHHGFMSFTFFNIRSLSCKVVAPAAGRILKIYKSVQKSCHT